MDQRTLALENALNLAAINAEFYLPLKDTIVIPELCAALISLADEVRRLRTVREDQAAQIRSLQWRLESALEATDSLNPTMSHILTGEVIRIGTMNVSGEELDGVFIRVPRETLAALKRTHLYERVEVIESEPTVRVCAEEGV